jgi:hypothetical protein
MKTPHAIFDLDGTISDDRWRRHMVRWDKEDPDARYLAYHKAGPDDPPINLHLVEAEFARDRVIIFLTARPEWCREHTEMWLKKHLHPIPFQLFMRKKDDHRPSTELKLGYFKSWATRVNIAVAYEDREDVAEVLRAEGFNVRLINTCGPGPDENGRPTGPAGILRSMAATCEERQGMYGEVWRTVPMLVRDLFPEGVPEWLLTDPRWHLFELLLVKVSRFAHSELKHQDSIHDAGVFSALIENVIVEGEEQ